MPATGKRLRLRAVLRGIARTYREHWRFLLPTALLVFIPLGLLEAVVHLTHDFEIGEADVLTGALFSAAALAQVLASGLGDQFYAGTVAAAVSESRRRERRHSLLEIARTVPYARLIAVDVLVALGTAVGVILLVLPGIVFYTWFALAAPVVKIERLGVRAALRRSRELVRGNFWQVLILLGSARWSAAR